MKLLSVLRQFAPTLFHSNQANAVAHISQDSLQLFHSAEPSMHSGQDSAIVPAHPNKHRLQFFTWMARAVKPTIKNVGAETLAFSPPPITVADIEQADQKLKFSKSSVATEEKLFTEIRMFDRSIEMGFSMVEKRVISAYNSAKKTVFIELTQQTSLHEQPYFQNYFNSTGQYPTPEVAQEKLKTNAELTCARFQEGVDTFFLEINALPDRETAAALQKLFWSHIETLKNQLGMPTDKAT